VTSRNQVTAVVLVLGLIGVLDFVTRVYVPRSAAGRDMQFEVAAPREQPLSLAEAQQRLQSWLPDQRPGTPSSGTDSAEDGTTSTADLPDRGELAGWHFVLRGVFARAPSQPFAAIEVMSSKGGAIEQHEVTEGQLIKGVRVERVGLHGVSLTEGAEAIELTLFVDADKTRTLGD
jgi:hypothetical protein